MSWYDKATGKLPYIGQCDRLRSSSDSCEKNWHSMMKLRQKVSMDELVSNCNVQAILEDDETLEDLGADDPGSACYRSLWGDVPCYFFQTAGFEFIWS